MIWKIKSFDGYVFGNAFLAAEDNPLLQPAVSSRMIKRGAVVAPAPGGMTREGDYLIVSVVGLNEISREAMINAIDVTNPNLRELIGTDDNNVDWYVMARPIRHVYDRGRDVLTFEVPDRIWRRKNSSSVSWKVTASGQSHTLAIGGNRPAQPVISITPRRAKAGGFAYARWILAYNPTSNVMLNYPLHICNANLDTAALVRAGKCQADGDDIWVIVDGHPVSRWLVGMNTTTTSVIATISFAPKIEMTLDTAIAGSGTVSEIVLEKTNANAAALKRLAAVRNKMVLIDNEVFTFSGVDKANYKLTGVTRAQRGTSMASHAVGAIVRWIQHDIWLVYGNSTMRAPEEDIAKKPIWNLSASTATSWSYTQYYDADYPTRPGTWTPSVIQSTGGKSRWYGGDKGADAEPATHMGMQAKAYQVGNTWKSETAQLEWRFYHPGGVTAVSATGKKYKKLASFGAIAGLQKKNTNAFTTVWTETAPGMSAVWTPFARPNVSLGGTFTALRFYFQCTLAAAAHNEADLQIDTLTLTLDSSKIPQVTVGVETDNYWMDTILRVRETGDEIRLRGICPINKTLIVDCENKTVTLDGENAFGFLSLNSARSAWLDLPPGTATLIMRDNGITDVDITVEWEDRQV